MRSGFFLCLLRVGLFRPLLRGIVGVYALLSKPRHYPGIYSCVELLGVLIRMVESFGKGALDGEIDVT